MAAGILCSALGQKVKTSTELVDLKNLAVALYDDHSQLEVAHKALNSATAKVDDRMQSLQTEIEQLKRINTAFRILEAHSIVSTANVLTDERMRLCLQTKLRN
eukprot:COSAG02_NODE_884_length_16193_cov_20.464086_2_plen_103_part_00